MGGGGVGRKNVFVFECFKIPPKSQNSNNSYNSYVTIIQVSHDGTHKYHMRLNITTKHLPMQKKIDHKDFSHF